MSKISKLIAKAAAAQDPQIVEPLPKVETPEPKQASAPQPEAPKPQVIMITKVASPSAILRQLICNSPTSDLKALRAKLTEMGIAIGDSSLSTVRSDTLATINAARATKHWVETPAS